MKLQNNHKIIKKNTLLFAREFMDQFVTKMINACGIFFYLVHKSKPSKGGIFLNFDIKITTSMFPKKPFGD